MMSDQQCSPVVRYWRKCFRRTEMEIKSEGRYAINAILGFRWRKGNAEAFSGVQMEMELKIISGMRSLGLSSVHVLP